jgi:hypothetical protein
MDIPPPRLDGADVLRYVVSGRGGFYDVIGAEPHERVVAMAICRYEGASDYYLFGCNSKWEVVADLDCVSIEDGMHIAAQHAGGEALSWIDAPKQEMR